MARKREPNKRSGMVEVALAAGTALGAVQTTRERLNQLLLPFAWVVGAAGLMALAACGALAAVPPDRWPGPLEPERLPVYAMASLAAASLLGWGCMLTGLGRLRQAIGWKLGGWAFVLLPVLCAGLVLAEGRLVELDTWPGGRELGLFACWYPPALVGLALAAFLLGELARRGEDGHGWQRAAWSLLLIGPYVLLMTTLFLGAHAPWLSESYQASLEELGGAALGVQIAIGYFLSAGAAAS